MEYLLEKVTNSSNMPVLFIIPYDGMYCGGHDRFYCRQLQMMDLKQFWVKPGICLECGFCFSYTCNL